MTSDVPIPTAIAENESQPSVPGPPMAVNAPIISRMMPGTEWWTCVPPAVTLRNGPRPSRISRVIVRVDTNVTTKETKHSISGSLPAAITSRCHYESMPLTLGARHRARRWRARPGRGSARLSGRVAVLQFLEHFLGDLGQVPGLLGDG